MLYIADQKNTRIYMNANFSEPLIYYAYFSQYEPVKYQKDVKFSEPDGIGWIHAVRLDNIHLIGGGSDYIKIICEERQKPGRAILITNEKLIEDVKNNSILYIGKTENDAMSLVYAYDMKKFPLEKNVCGN